MGRRTLIGRIAALGLVPFLLLGGAVPGLTLFRCRRDHSVHFSCPCAKRHGAMAGTRDQIASLTRPSCCEITQLKLAHDAFRSTIADLTPASMPLVVLITSVPPDPHALASRTGEGARFRATGPPVRLRTQTFLN